MADGRVSARGFAAEVDHECGSSPAETRVNTNPTRSALIAVRTYPDSKAAILARADREDTDPADLVRRLLAFAMTHMPPRWGKETT